MKTPLGFLAALTVLAAGSLGASAAGDAKIPRHLIYLHGRIIQEQQNPRPQHPQFGYYELEKIVAEFRGRGFVVSSGIRPKTTSMSESADRVVEEVQSLLRSGVPADHVTVVGASMGAEIALLASVRLQNPDVRFCLLGACLAENVRRLRVEGGKAPSGHLLAIREASDDLGGPCPSWSEETNPGSRFVAREIVIKTGLGHGFLYRPLPEWVNPVAKWAAATQDE